MHEISASASQRQFRRSAERKTATTIFVLPRYSLHHQLAPPRVQRPVSQSSTFYLRSFKSCTYLRCIQHHVRHDIGCTEDKGNFRGQIRISEPSVERTRSSQRHATRAPYKSEVKSLAPFAAVIGRGQNVWSVVQCNARAEMPN